MAVQSSAGVLTLLALLFSAAVASSLTTDGLSLLALKSAISSDPTRVLDAWSDSDPSPCRWEGVTCHRGRVTALFLSNRSLRGYLPSELSLLSALQTLSLPLNFLSGPIPASISELGNLTALDLSSNNLSGPIPPSIGALTSLTRLDLSSNLLNGSLPPSVAEIKTLAGVLNLSSNRFAGPIPPAYGEIPVSVSLDLRFNNLSGEIPQVGSLLNQGPTAFAGNPLLCGFPLKSLCDDSDRKQDPRIPVQNPNSGPIPIPIETDRQRGRGGGGGLSPAVTVPILVGVVLAGVASVLVLQWQLRRRREEAKLGGKGKSTSSPARNEDRRGDGRSGEIYVAVDEGFGLELEELLRASAYVVGKSRSGIVYKVVVGRGSAVAVRRLSEAEDGEPAAGDDWRRRRGFEAEAMAVARAKHPNVVSLKAYYYAPDEKLLIYDYIPNGTLHSALHGNLTAAPALPWAARLGIAQGAARGLAYLHECSPRKYVHGGIKSSKILLDDDLRPYVSGFGLGRVIGAVGSAQKFTHPLSKGRVVGPTQLQVAAPGSPSAVGYLAPEARAAGGVVGQKGDVYAFGVVLMELVTGREAEGLEEWVRRAFKEERPLSEVVDPALLHEVHAKKAVLAVFHAALGCTDVDPEARPRMRAVAESLDRVGTPGR